MPSKIDYAVPKICIPSNDHTPPEVPKMYPQVELLNSYRRSSSTTITTVNGPQYSSTLPEALAHTSICNIQYQSNGYNTGDILGNKRDILKKTRTSDQILTEALELSFDKSRSKKIAEKRGVDLIK